MQRSFGTQIIKNRRPETKLSEVTRAGIITKLEARVLKLKITAKFSVNQSTVYNTIN